MPPTLHLRGGRPFSFLNHTAYPRTNSMKLIYLCLAVFCATITLPGCGAGSQEPSLANEGITADDIAKYEAELAAIQGEDAYAEEMDADDTGTAAGTEAAGTEAAGTEAAGTEAAGTEAPE